MRKSLFISTLFAVSLVGGIALAERPSAVDRIRQRGDTVDKNYAARDAALKTASMPGATAASAKVRSPLEARNNERVNCSDTGADCGHTARPAARAATTPAASNARAVKNPLDLGHGDRMTCNEADECSMSSKGAKALYAKNQVAKGSGGRSHSMNAAQNPAAVERTQEQAGSDRMACNEADECMMSSKAAKKIWRTESFKHGTVNRSEPALNLTDANRAKKEVWMKERYESVDAQKAEKARADKR